MNIMFLIFSFNVGGIEHLLIDMTNELKKRSINVYVCIINEDYDEELLSQLASDAKIIKLGRHAGSKCVLKYMLQLAKIVKRTNIDILHCQGINCVIFSFFAKILCPDISIINTVHDVGNYPSYSDFKIGIQNIILDKTIAISKAVEQEILCRKQQPEKVVTIYNAISLDKFRLSEKVFDNSRIVLGNVARFFPQKKGQDVLVEAVLRIKQKGKYKVLCKFAGDVFKGQEKDYIKLVQQIDSYALQNEIEFCGGISDVSEFLGSIDVFVLPSRYEGFGIALIEALAEGIPVVASDIDGPKEIFELALKDGINIGVMAQCGDAVDFSEKILNCIMKYSEYDKRQIREFTKRHFSIEHMIDEHLKVYNSLLNTKAKCKVMGVNG